MVFKKEFAKELSKNRDRSVLAAWVELDLGVRLTWHIDCLVNMPRKLFQSKKETLTFHFQLDFLNEHSHSVNDSTQLVEI
jgi:hypothetical protein